MKLANEHTSSGTATHPDGSRSRTRRRTARARRGLLAAGAAVALLAACGSDDAASPAATATDTDGHDDGHGDGSTMRTSDRVIAQLAAAGFQDVETAEAAGYASTIDTLGCFQDPERGGMGLHYLNEELMDATVDLSEPEALVYELDRTGAVAGLVAHEYIVPIDAWTATEPPELAGVEFHRHPTLPLWVLHAWLWKDNPSGVFEDWNPAVRQCPAGVPIFGTDLPAP
jgi:hypothetical protein